MKKVLCVTDSLGLPRPGVEYGETWVELLRQEFPDVRILTRSERAATTNTLREPDSLENFDPDVAITQLGVTDCAPRYFRKVERRLLRAIPSEARSYYMSFWKKLRRRRKHRRYITTTEFRSNLHHYYEKTADADCPTISILIAPPTAEFIEKNPKIDESIATFNDIYQDVAAEYDHVTIVQPFEDIDVEHVMVDEHHPNPDGHRLIYERVSAALETVL